MINLMRSAPDGTFKVETDKCIPEMLTWGQIERTNDSPWSAPVVLVTTKDGVCVGYVPLAE